MKTQYTTVIPVPMPYENKPMTKSDFKTFAGSLIFLHIILLIMFLIRAARYFHRKRERSFAAYISDGSAGFLPYMALIVLVIDVGFFVIGIGSLIGKYL